MEMHLPPAPKRVPSYGSYAAHFADVPTERLVREAQLRLDQVDSDDLPPGEYNVNIFLVALHERADRSVYDAAVGLTRRRSVEQRLLGLQILRELGHPDRRPVFWETWGLLERLARRETNSRVLAWVLRCLGWLHDPRALDTLLLFTESEHDEVRYVVASSLMGCAPDTDDPVVVDFLVGFCEDEDPQVRWTALYDFTQWVTLDSPRIRSMLTNRRNDEDEQVRELAAGALASRHLG